MKRVLTIACLLVCSLGLSAQRYRVVDAEYFPKNEIYIQYGTPTVLELSNMLSGDIRQGQYVEGDYVGGSQNHKFSGVVGVGYNFNVTRGLYLGAYFGLGYADEELYLSGKGGEAFAKPVTLGKMSVISYVGEISAGYTYWSEGMMEISSALYLGVAYLDETMKLYTDDYYNPISYDKWKFSYHVTALKFRIGEAIGGFAELGFGYRGLVNIGLSIKI